MKWALMYVSLFQIPTLSLSLVQLHLKECDLLTPALSLCLLQLHEICDVSLDIEVNSIIVIVVGSFSYKHDKSKTDPS